jgi:hypothetical protein
MATNETKLGTTTPPEQQPEPDLYPDLDEDLQEAVDKLVGLDLSKKDDREDIMKIRTHRINYVLVAGAPINVPTAIHCILAVLEPGTQLGTITSKLCKNQKDGVVRAMVAPEAVVLCKVLPQIVCKNPSIG